MFRKIFKRFTGQFISFLQEIFNTIEFHQQASDTVRYLRETAPTWNNTYYLNEFYMRNTQMLLLRIY